MHLHKLLDWGGFLFLFDERWVNVSQLNKIKVLLGSFEQQPNFATSPIQDSFAIHDVANKIFLLKNLYKNSWWYPNSSVDLTSQHRNLFIDFDTLKKFYTLIFSVTYSIISWLTIIFFQIFDTYPVNKHFTYKAQRQGHLKTLFSYIHV